MKPLFLQLFILCTSVLISCKDKTDDMDPDYPSYKDSTFTHYFRRTSDWVAGDGGFSIPLNNGKSLWLWGDSHINGYNPETGTVHCLFQVRNAGLAMGISNPDLATTLISTASPKSYFYFGTDNDYWFWPGSGFAKGDTAYVYLQRIHKTAGGGSFGFEVVDSLYIARIHIPSMEVKGYIQAGPRNGIDFGCGVITDGAYTYVYGKKNNGMGNDIFVARFTAEDPYAAWEYYAGSGWTDDISKAKKIHDEFTSSFHMIKWKHKYIMITTEFSVGCDQGDEIYAYTSDHPYGGFSNKKIIWKVDERLEGHTPFFYLANAHPEYDNGQNELLVTYCINGYGDCVETCIGGQKDPDSYRPKAVRVPWKAIDPSL